LSSIRLIHISKRERVLCSLGDEDNAGNISLDTIPDNKARGVYVDLSILLPRAVYSDGSSTVWNLQSFLSRVSHISKMHREVRIESLDVSLLLELKRPPPRHLGSVLSLLRQVIKSLRNGQHQAMQQAHCLFSSPKYAKQKSVMLIAATGEWWTFSQRSRKDFRYHGAFEMPLGGPPDDDDEPDDEPDDLAIMEATLVAPLDIDKDLDDRQERLEKAKNDEKARREVIHRQEKTARKDKWARDMAEIEIERQETADRKQKQGQERQKRYERRSEAQKEKEKHFLILEKMIEEAQDMDKQYDDVFLEKVWGHYIHSGLASCSEEGVYFQPHLADSEIDSWTKPMRLGSAVSNAYLEYVSEQLAIIGDEEKTRRLQHTANMVQ
jgi:hypothetical protein